jgi:tetratricopeptide (TPR) repeat protein
MQRQTPEKRNTVKLIMSWVGGITAVIGLVASLSGGLRWFENHHKQKTELAAQIALAQSQAAQGEYEASVRTYQGILKEDPLNEQAQEEQLNATMLWVENFHVLGRDDRNAAELAASQLDEIMPVLDAGLTRSKGSRAADVQAHLGWAHWLNWHIAEREFGPAAEQNLRGALKLDQSNVYANAMLGNWMLQTNGSFPEAISHFATAVATGKARPLVRSMQLGGLTNNDRHGARAELVKAVNDMRKNGEEIDDSEKRRILAFCYNPALTDQAELSESLSAVPQDEAWKTYLWLDDKPDDETNTSQAVTREFINADLLEISGKRPESLAKYRLLQQELNSQPGTLKNRVDEAVKRLSRD